MKCESAIRRRQSVGAHPKSRKLDPASGVHVAHVRIHDHIQEHVQMEAACAPAIVCRLYPRDIKPVYYRADCLDGMIVRN